MSLIIINVQRNVSIYIFISKHIQVKKKGIFARKIYFFRKWTNFKARIKHFIITFQIKSCVYYNFLNNMDLRAKIIIFR